VANLSKTLHINFYQNRSSIVEVMIKKIWRVFYASQYRYYILIIIIFLVVVVVDDKISLSQAKLQEQIM